MNHYRLYISEIRDIKKLKPLSISNNTYSNMRFKILLNDKQVCIEYYGSAVINVGSVFTDARGIFKATAKYALMLFILHNKKFLRQKYIFLQDTAGHFFNVDHKIYTLYDNKKLNDFNLDVKSQLAYIPMLTEKHQQEAPYVILANYVMAAAQKYELEKFNYLWRAYNSFYKQLAKKTINKKRITEIDGLGTLELYLTGIRQSYDSNNNFFREKRSQVVSKFIKEGLLIKYCEQNETNIIYDFSPFLSEVGYQYEIDVFVQTQLAYYYRCSLFHGESFLGLFLIKGETIYRIIKIINQKIKRTIESEFKQMFTA